jgi:hypothetical protein
MMTMKMKNHDRQSDVVEPSSKCISFLKSTSGRSLSHRASEVVDSLVHRGLSVNESLPPELDPIFHSLT